MIELPELRLDPEVPVSALDGVEPDRRAVIPKQELDKIQSKNADGHVARLTHMNSELQARVIELEEAIRGPGDFATWRDAAVDERLNNVRLKRTIEGLETELRDATQVSASLSEAQQNIRELEQELATYRMLFNVIGVAVDSQRQLVEA